MQVLVSVNLALHEGIDGEKARYHQGRCTGNLRLALQEIIEQEDLF